MYYKSNLLKFFVLILALLYTQASISTECEPSSYPIKCNMYDYVRFWNYKIFKSHDCHQSSARHSSKQKYVVFEPDRGGWNNIRMAAETSIIFSHITGRTLVLPPKTKFYLLDKNNDGKDNESTFSTFFDLFKLANGMDIISMEQFLETVAKKPGLLNASYPSNIPVRKFAVNNDRLWKYLEEACYVRHWDVDRYFLAFNISSVNGVLTFGNIDNTTERAKKFASGRSMINYDESFDSQKCIYFPGDYRDTHRLLTHYYSYLFLANPREERIYKRLVRDRLHYRDDIFCGAGHIVKRLHEYAALLTNKPIQDPKYYNNMTLGGKMNNVDKDNFATYHAFHIRRGDFQYDDVRISAEAIWSNTQHLLNRSVSSLIYIATDERNLTFFAPFMKNFTVKFLHDFKNDFGTGSMKMNKNHVGMIEQVVCANAYTFIGTPYSTFTGYITRMRGFYRDERYSRTYYTMPNFMHQLAKQTDPVGPYWAREFSSVHRNADDDTNLYV